MLLAAAGFELASLSLLVVADTMPLLVAVFALQGLYRALESGPLDAWYVDAALAADPTPTSRGRWVPPVPLSGGTGGRDGRRQWPRRWDPIATVNPLVTPILVALILRGIELASIFRLMIEPTRPPGRPDARSITAVVGDSLQMVRRSHVLAALIAIELLWGVGMIAFEIFTPLRLEAVLDDADSAAALFGPTNAIAWAAAAGAAAAAPSLARHAGAPLAGAAMQIAQGVAVAGIALATGPAGVIVAYLATMAIHGAANPDPSGAAPPRRRRLGPPGNRALCQQSDRPTGRRRRRHRTRPARQRNQPHGQHPDGRHDPRGRRTLVPVRSRAKLRRLWRRWRPGRRARS